MHDIVVSPNHKKPMVIGSIIEIVSPVPINVTHVCTFTHVNRHMHLYTCKRGIIPITNIFRLTLITSHEFTYLTATKEKK